MTTTKPRPVARPKVEPFARYKGTSAWRKYRRKVRAYAWHLAHKKDEHSTPSA